MKHRHRALPPRASAIDDACSMLPASSDLAFISLRLLPRPRRFGARPDPPLGHRHGRGSSWPSTRVMTKVPLMLWWFIGVWLASGAVLPAFWLLSMTHRAALKIIGPKGLYGLSGLVSVVALILLFVFPFRASDITVRDMPSTSAVAQTPTTYEAVAEARPIQVLISATLSPSQLSVKLAQTDPPSFGDAEQVVSVQPRFDDVGESADDASRQTDAAVPQVPAAGALLTAPAYPKAPSAGRDPAHRRARGPLVRPYVTQLSHGTWLFPPNQTGDGSNG
jgi:hypothetical protein